MEDQSAVVTKEQSYAAFANLLRNAFSSIAYYRGFCDDTCFERRRFGSIEVRKLIPQSAEATTLHEWIEDGVLEAFKQGYLERVALQVWCPATEQLLEVYSFAFGYSSDGLPCLDVECLERYDQSGAARQVCHISSQQQCQTTRDAANGEVTVARPSAVTKAEMRENVVRVLVEVVLALEQMPPPTSDRCLNMMISYVDATPHQYQPQHFHAISTREATSVVAQARGLSMGSALCEASGYHAMKFGLQYEAKDGAGTVGSSQDLSKCAMEESPSHPSAAATFDDEEQVSTTRRDTQRGVLGEHHPHGVLGA